MDTDGGKCRLGVEPKAEGGLGMGVGGWDMGLPQMRCSACQLGGFVGGEATSRE